MSHSGNWLQIEAISRPREALVLPEENSREATEWGDPQRAQKNEQSQMWANGILAPDQELHKWIWSFKGHHCLF